MKKQSENLTNIQITSSSKNCGATQPSVTSIASSSKVSIDACFQDSFIQKAEIMWALKQVYSGLSDNYCKNVVSLFQSMFPGSQIAQKVRLEPNKRKYMVNHGITTYMKDILRDDVRKFDLYVVSFDESTNDITQICEMDICQRFWNYETSKVEDRYWDSEFLGHTTHGENGSVIDGRTKCELLQKVKDSKDDHSKLIDFGTCNLHTVHGVFKAGSEESGWNMKKLPKSCHKILKDSPARRDDFISITGCTKYPLPFCATRYVFV